mmetsp:Transcript_31514/g.81531  ORF Transcript_31514/g.81531 Transcript_31514/m.81531 type:complete len:274 (+) Transcript_31514:417-1238(+)
MQGSAGEQTVELVATGLGQHLLRRGRLALAGRRQSGATRVRLRQLRLRGDDGLVAVQLRAALAGALEALPLAQLLPPLRKRRQDVEVGDAELLTGGHVPGGAHKQKVTDAAVLAIWLAAVVEQRGAQEEAAGGVCKLGFHFVVMPRYVRLGRRVSCSGSILPPVKRQEGVYLLLARTASRTEPVVLQDSFEARHMHPGRKTGRQRRRLAELPPGVQGVQITAALGVETQAADDLRQQVLLRASVYTPRAPAPGERRQLLLGRLAKREGLGRHD